MTTERPPEEPRDLAEWLWRLNRYQRAIFVRHQVGGRWRTVSLAELDARAWAVHVARWLDDGVNPVRVREPEECGEPAPLTQQELVLVADAGRGPDWAALGILADLLTERDDPRGDELRRRVRELVAELFPSDSGVQP